MVVYGEDLGVGGNIGEVVVVVDVKNHRHVSLHSFSTTTNVSGNIDNLDPFQL